MLTFVRAVDAACWITSVRAVGAVHETSTAVCGRCSVLDQLAACRRCSVLDQLAACGWCSLRRYAVCGQTSVCANSLLRAVGTVRWISSCVMLLKCKQPRVVGAVRVFISLRARCVVSAACGV